VNNTRAAKEQLERWMTTLSNWGRWGKEDELGTLNLITPAKRKEAARLARAGTSVSLAHDFLTQKDVDSPSPYRLELVVNNRNVIAMERQDISPHGRAFSHLDALCHVGGLDGKLYNGFVFDEVVIRDGGCSHLGISPFTIVTRAVLVDIPRLKKLPYLDPGTLVLREDIEAWEKQSGAKLSAGDVLLLRTGRWARRAQVGAFNDQAGFDPSFVPLLKERDIAVLGGDTDQDGAGRVPGFPNAIHRIALAALGMPIMDNLDLEKLSETAAALKRWEFMLVVSPLSIKGGSGSPVNPTAIF
jgi:kynurenine formamidase